MGETIGDAAIESSGHQKAEALVTLILEETPAAIEAFTTREEMVAYIREAIESGYMAGMVPNR